MFHVEKCIAPGHTVLCYTGFGYIHVIRVPKNGYDTSFTIIRGITVKHGDIIGLRYGSKITFGKFGLKRHRADTIEKTCAQKTLVDAGNKKENIKSFYLLRPTSPAISKSLRHQTQIIFPEDMSAICSEMNLKPGSNVLESGTGSGSLTHRLGLSVSPSGLVTTAEFHATRFEKLTVLFQESNLKNVKIIQGDITCPLTLNSMSDESQDAIFLDIPNPWDFLKNKQDRVLKKSGCFASFSPCIEQVQKTVALLELSSVYSNIRTIEVQARWYDVTCSTRCEGLNNQTLLTSEEDVQRLLPQNHGYGHTAYMTFALRV